MFAWALWRSRCRPPSESACARVRPLLYLATLLALAAALLVWRCCDHLHRKDFDLAMVGIYWEGQNPGETGAHLRWAFRYGLPFPQGGFDLYRRDPVNTGWNKLNGAPIQPADVWTDGAPAPVPSGSTAPSTGSIRPVDEVPGEPVRRSGRHGRAPSLRATLLRAGTR